MVVTRCVARWPARCRSEITKAGPGRPGGPGSNRAIPHALGHLALLIALTLLPAMLGFAGPKVARFARLPLLGARAERVARRSAADPDSTAGAGWARFVVRHRVPEFLGGIALLGVLAIPAASIHLGLPSGASQSADNTQRKAYDLTTEGFGAGYNGPLLI